MRREVVLAVLVMGCGVPVDIGMLEDTTTGSSGSVTDDATLTESMTGQLPMTSMTSEVSSSESGDEPPPPLRHDFAILEGPAVDTGSSESETGEDPTSMSTSASTVATSTSGSDSGDDLEVGTLTIYATTGTASCEDPFGIDPCPATWTYSFRLPPELVVVGATGRLEDFGSFATEAGPEVGECTSGGGGTLFGNFEITAVDDTRIAGRMFDLELTMWETEVDFNAPICGV